MSPELLDRIRELPGHLARRVLGQEAALNVISPLACHWLGGLMEKAPRFLLLGPTGVGKTECAIALAEVLFGGPPLRIDMSEYQRAESIDTLLGNRSGDGGLFRQTLCPGLQTLLLFDEIEKAHPRVLDLFLQILEPGHISSADGCKIDLRSIPIICTSNLATGAVTDVHRLSAQAQEDHVLEQIRRELRPETLNRFDAIVFFQPLDVSAQEALLRAQAEQYFTWLRTQGFRVHLSPEAERWLMLRGFDFRWGARPLRRAIRFHVSDAIVQALLRGETGSGELEVEGPHLRLIQS